MLKSFKNKEVIVTGGAGLIGSFLVDQLVELGAHVIVIDDFSKGLMSNIEHNSKNIEIRKGNLEDINFAKQALNEGKIIFHLASRAYGIGYENENKIKILIHNEKITNNLIEVFKITKPKHLLITSSSCVYDDNLSNNVKESFELEGTPEKANISYGWAKRFLEQKMLLLSQDINCSLYVVRPFNIYGERYNWVGKYSQAIPMIIKKILDGNDPVNIWGSGKQKRTYVHAHDCARIMLKIMLSNYTSTPVNIGFDDLISIEEVTNIICRLSNLSPKIDFDKNMPEGKFIKSSNTLLLKSILGSSFRQEINLENGIIKMFDWYNFQFNKSFKL